MEMYSRFSVLQGIGELGLKRLRQAKVAVVGMGGLGCVTAAQFTALGVGHLRIVDYDVVELSNLQRQQLYTIKDIGLPKVEVAKRRLLELNPDVDVEPLALALTASTASGIVNGMTVIVDGLDRFTPRFILNRACIDRGVPYVFAGALGAAGNLTTIIPGKTPCLECIFGEIEDTQPSCATVGIYPTLLGIIGNLQVQEALRIILDKRPNLANQLGFFNMNNYEFDFLPIIQNTNCPVCGKEKQKPQTLPEEVTLVELCTKDTFLLHADAPPLININHAASILQKQYTINAKSTMGVQFQYTPTIEVTLVGEGNIMVKGTPSADQAKNIYHKILHEISEALTPRK